MKRNNATQNLERVLLEMASGMKILHARCSRIERALIQLHEKGIITDDTGELAEIASQHQQLCELNDRLKAGHVMQGSGVKQ